MWGPPQIVDAAAAMFFGVILFVCFVWFVSIAAPYLFSRIGRILRDYYTQQALELVHEQAQELERLRKAIDTLNRIASGEDD